MFSKRFALLALLISALAAAPANAGQLKGENLIAPIPSGFKLGYSQGAFMEYVPKGETVKDWSQMLTISVLLGRSLDADEYSKGLAAFWRKACPGGEAVKVTSGSENHYPFSLWLYACPLNPQSGKPETMTMKSIRGDDSFYSIQYAHRKTADKSTVTPQATYLRTVSVCDTRKADRLCPAGM